MRHRVVYEALAVVLLITGLWMMWAQSREDYVSGVWASNPMLVIAAAVPLALLSLR